ncbi:site-specific integrase [Rhodococcus sp. YH3-3]|uniref:tyrosine-type recombinase/integrase n=1 Tax=Rhodococcus sp. YH3-3 TaxID=1803579 RepID=UPI0007DB1EE7|nr:site-specific integrase [Rhodococcus sp. YH3-3]
MTTIIEPVSGTEVVGTTTAARSARLKVQMPGRVVAEQWPETETDREQAWARLTSDPFVLDVSDKQSDRRIGLALVLDWLCDHPGHTWQERWVATGIEQEGASWRLSIRRWLGKEDSRYRREMLCRAVPTVISADLVRPPLAWMMSSKMRRSLVADVSRSFSDDGFARLEQFCAADPMVSTAAASRCFYRAALIVAAKGGTISDVTPGDVLELLDIEADLLGNGIGATRLFYRAMHMLGNFGGDAPQTLRELRSPGQRSPAELIDHYAIKCRPIRDLLVDYLRERQPVLDYGSLMQLAWMLGKLFWADLEEHNPGIDSLRLSADVADAWKHRLRSVRTTKAGAAGAKSTGVRLGYQECLTPIRSFYLDLAQWALEDPARWGPWVAPCPIRSGEIDRRKDKLRRKSRMDARTRARLPVLPALVRCVDISRREAAELLQAALAAQPGETFTAAGQTLIRSHTRESTPGKAWAHDPETGTRRDLNREESQAFWAFAVVEVLRATGVRIEELTELSHHSLIQYRLPNTGELVPLLQIAPSKTDAERLLLVSPELADVLSEVISRIRGSSGAVPLVSGFDVHERMWLPPAPLLFQRYVGSENQAIGPPAIRGMLTKALAATGLIDHTTGEPLRFTPHDFRRMFITDAVLNGLPPHIAQIIAGHRDINVTMGYKAVYPHEAIEAHHGFLARRRSLRPSEEYRVPTDEEWAEFLGHFERRTVSTGTCGRAFGSACIHEHACVRCSMLWPDPSQRQRLADIRDNLRARIAEAEREGWLGEVEGLQISLLGADDKLSQIDRRTPVNTNVALGMPTMAKGI